MSLKLKNKNKKVFGSKKNTAKNKVDVSINTMDDDTKGIGAKNVSVEYSNTTGSSSQAKQDSQKVKNNKNTANISASQSIAHQSMTSPFGSGTTKLPEKEIETPKPPNVNSNADMTPHGLPKGTFSMPNINVPRSNTNENNISSINQTPNLKTDNVAEKPFLHQATDKISDKKPNKLNNSVTSNSAVKKSSVSSIIWIIAFILLLGTILLGAYYFYMKKDDQVNSPVNKNKQETVKKTPNISKTNTKQTGVSVHSQNTSQTKPQANATTGSNTSTQSAQTSSTQAKLPTSFNTSETTFIDDLGRFLLTLKNSGNEKALKGGIIVTPMIDANKPLSAQGVIKSMGMTNLFQETDLKPACKLFVMKDADKMRVALVFELANGVDDKIIKENIIKNENNLPEIMKALFVNEVPPTVPPTIKFSINKDNLNSRYFNYKPGDTFTSNDWNILDLGQGKIIYFATSKNLAEKITNYFMKLVVK